MAQLPGSERYRVRQVHERECAVPDEVEATRFASLAAADAYARSLQQSVEQRVLVEKRSAGGCWLALAEHNRSVPVISCSAARPERL